MNVCNISYGQKFKWQIKFKRTFKSTLTFESQFYFEQTVKLQISF